MLTLHLYGKLRRFSQNPKLSDISTIEVPYKTGETINACLERVGINTGETGELFINHRHSDLNEIIPHDNSRLGVFSSNMKLLDGGLYIKYCGYNSNIT